MNKHRYTVGILIVLLTVTALAVWQSQRSAQPETAANEQPNILLIVADDMGIADLGAFGGEIPTPHLDYLAEHGVRLTNFHVSPTCSPTRASLLTGVDHHLAGLGNMAEELAPNQKNQRGYEGYLNFDVITVAELLDQENYHTYYSGKWHLGKTEETSPYARGFGQSFAMLSGAADHFNDMRPVYAPTPDSLTPYRQNGVALKQLPDKFQYSTQFYTEHLIEMIESNREDDRPFFAVLSYTAPHWPVQAPSEIVDRYRGQYDQGFDVIIEQRLKNQKELGLIPAEATVAPRALKGMAWDQLTPEQQRTEIRAMEIYAAMIDRIDHYVGRLMQYLKETGEYDNTVIVFISDDGAEGHDLDETWPRDKFPDIRKVVEDTHDFSYESMGMLNSYVMYGPNWARVGAPVFRLHKGFTTEGGVRAASFWHYPPALPSQVIHAGQFTVKDIAPTLLAVAGVEHPGRYWKGRTIHPMTGNNIWSYLRDGAEALPPVQPIVYELFGKRYVKDYPWKMSLIAPPYGTGEWQLYNLADDLGETTDLAEQHPEQVERLNAIWQSYVEENNVILPDWVSGY